MSMQTNRKVMITRRRRRREYQQRPKFFMYLLSVVGIIVAIVGGFFGTMTLTAAASAYAVYDSFAQQLPDPGAIETEQEDFETTKLYDRTGLVVLYEIFDPRRGDRNYVPLGDIPEFCRDATIILEDKTFYVNPGFDPEGIARAFFQNLRGGRIQGGSSITQQLIKNILISEEERLQLSYTRKVKEIILAMEITRRYSKDQILEWYFNTNSYFNLAYGIDAAAQVYFDKPVSALSDAECAMLAPIPQYPLLNPIDNFEQAKARQRITLNRMVEEGAITAERADELYSIPIIIKPIQERFDILAPHFAIYVRKELERTYPADLIYRGGLKVYTTLDYGLNAEAQKVALRHVEELQENGNNASNACVVSIRPRTGEILAMVGSVNYWDEDNDGNVNVCTAEPGRQPGSAFKPFSYLTLFAQGNHNAATMVMDVRQSFPDLPNPPYVPENYDREYHGPVRLRNALQNSYNIPAVWVMHQAGVKNVIATAHRMGITTLNEDYYGLALTLGGGEVKPIDMAYSFGVLANLGTMAGQPVNDVNRRPGRRGLDPVSILRIEDNEGNIIYEYREPVDEQVVDPALAFLLTDILSDNAARAPAFGYNSLLKRDFEDRPIAAKTGTTNNFRDNWTVGFTPQLVTAVWVGNNNNEPMKDVTGLSGAAPIWHDVMLHYHRDLPITFWQRPPGLVATQVDAVSGLLPTEHTPQAVTELFLEGTVPTQEDNVHQVFRINRENGKLATVYTPPELVEERVFEIYPPVAADWVRDNEIPQPPTDYDDSSGPTGAVGPVAIANPRPYEYVSGRVTITGSAKADPFQLYRLEYGQGLNPTEWRQLGEDRFNPRENAPLEFWDTVGEVEGLYTLQLTVMRPDQSIERQTTQVTVDNTPPVLALINPEPDKVYVMEEDEWVNFQVDAIDNFAMDRVEFYMNNYLVGETTVAPFTMRWTIEMADLPVSPANTPVLASGAGYTDTYLVPVQANGYTIGYRQILSGGFSVISTTWGYTETHKVHVVAVDAAGNTTQTEPFWIHVTHAEADEDEDNPASETDDGALLSPTYPVDAYAWRDDDVDFNHQR